MRLDIDDEERDMRERQGTAGNRARQRSFIVTARGLVQHCTLPTAPVEESEGKGEVGKVGKGSFQNGCDRSVVMDRHRVADRRVAESMRHNFKCSVLYVR